jgi:flagellar hook-associated protein 2
MATNPLGLSGSGIIDTQQIVSQLMQVERQPLLKLQKKEADYNSKISAYGTLSKALSDLKNAAKALRGFDAVGMKATSSDTSIFSATATNEASAGSYSIKVSNIASSQKIYSGIFAAESASVADLSVVDSQKLKIQVGSGDAKEITINSSNNTLSGVRNAINNANAGVKASIINDGSGYRLILSASDTGEDNRIKIEVAEDGTNYTGAGDDIDNTGLSKLAFNATYDSDGNATGGVRNMTQSQAAVDAKLNIDGLDVTRSTNTITDLITGVTLNLKKGDSATTVDLDVAQDTASYKSKLSAFVTAYNKVVDTITSLKGDVNKKGTLSGDSTLTNAKNSIRSAVTGLYDGNSLTLMGLSHDKYGKLSFDSDKFDDVFSDSSTDVINTVKSMATSLDTKLGNYINSVIPSRKDGYQQIIDRLKNSEDDLNRRLDLTEVSLKKKYSSLDQMLSQFQGTSSYLTQQLGSKK